MCAHAAWHARSSLLADLCDDDNDALTQAATSVKNAVLDITNPYVSPPPSPSPPSSPSPVPSLPDPDANGKKPQDDAKHDSLSSPKGRQLQHRESEDGHAAAKLPPPPQIELPVAQPHPPPAPLPAIAAPRPPPPPPPPAALPPPLPVAALKVCLYGLRPCSGMHARSREQRSVEMKGRTCVSRLTAGQGRAGASSQAQAPLLGPGASAKAQGTSAGRAALLQQPHQAVLVLPAGRTGARVPCARAQGTFWAEENGEEVPLPPLDWENLAEMFAQVRPRRSSFC